MPTNLNCTDADTAIASLADIFRISVAGLREHLTTFEIDWKHRAQDGDEQLHRSLGFELADLPTAQFTTWFHATRMTPGAEFSEGLLPTMTALEKLWPTLAALAQRWISAEEWEEFRRTWGTADRPSIRDFERKQQLENWEGPFAFLVRACALSGRESGHKDFTEWGSEALEDICGDFEDVFRKPLRKAYVAATRPCLVVFATPWCRPDYVRAALLYAHSAMRGFEPGPRGNSNFVGNGKHVPLGWIQKIEWL